MGYSVFQKYSKFSLITLLIVVLPACSLIQRSARTEEGCRLASGSLAQEVVAFSGKQLSGDITRGQNMFLSLCSGCHVHARRSEFALLIRQAESQGMEPTIPPQLSCEQYQESLSQEYLAATIEYGMHNDSVPAHSMPAWRHVLNDQDVADLVAYIVTIGDNL